MGRTSLMSCAKKSTRGTLISQPMSFLMPIVIPVVGTTLFCHKEIRDLLDVLVWSFLVMGVRFWMLGFRSGMLGLGILDFRFGSLVL